MSSLAQTAQNQRENDEMSAILLLDERLENNGQVTIDDLVDVTQVAFVRNVRKTNSTYGIDPAFLDFLRELLDKLLEMFGGCQLMANRTTADTVAMCNEPNRRQKRRLRGKVKYGDRRSEGLGREDYRQYGKQMVDAVLETGQAVTVEMMDGLFIYGG